MNRDRKQKVMVLRKIFNLNFFVRRHFPISLVLQIKKFFVTPLLSIFDPGLLRSFEFGGNQPSPGVSSPSTTGGLIVIMPYLSDQ